MAGSNPPKDWDPVKDHYKTSNVYRSSRVVTHRDGSEAEASDEKEKDLFIANIPTRITTDGLINLLGTAGRIQEIRLVPDKKNPQNQLGFVKTFSSADGLRIIEQFNNFRISGSTLKVHIQRPRRTENSSDFGRPASNPVHVSPAPPNSASALQPESFTEPEQHSVGRLSLSPFGAETMKPVGRSKLILATALRHQSQQEPQVGLSRAGTGATNGFSHHSSHSGSSSAEEPTGTRDPSKKIDMQPESQRPTRQKRPESPTLTSRNVSDRVSQPESQRPTRQKRPESPTLTSRNFLDRVSQLESQRPTRQKRPESPTLTARNVSDRVSHQSKVRKTGPCLKCGNLGDKYCSKCKGIYCSVACQRDHFPVHKSICTPYNRDEDEFQRRFDAFVDNVNEGGQEEEAEVGAWPTTPALPLNVPIEVALLIPAFSPSKFYVFPNENKAQLEDLTLRLNEHYAVEKNRLKPPTSPDIGDICVCQYSADGCWYRAEVEDVISRSRVLVRYIDYGNEEEVDVSTILELSREFKAIPNLAVLCGLANIEPAPTNAGDTGWSKAAIDLSRKTIFNCIVLITPVEVVSGVCYVEMKMSDSGAGVAEMFVQAGVARYTRQKKKTLAASSVEQLPALDRLPSLNQLPSSRPVMPADSLPSSRPISSANQLPPSGPSPSPNQLPSSKPSPSPNQLPSLRTSPSASQLPSPRPLPSASQLPSSKALTTAKALPSLSPLTVETGAALNLSRYGWPADLSNVVGKKMSFEVVEHLPPGDLWVRIDPLPGHETMPLVRLSLAERYRLTPSSPYSTPAHPTPEQPEVEQWRHLSFNDLPVLQLRNEMKVEVTFPQNPASFWCHDLEQMAPIMMLQNTLKPDTSSPVPKSFQPEMGDICFGFYQKYSEWYRVMISERRHETVEAFLIDYGETISISLNDVRPLPQELSQHSPMAFQCQLIAFGSLQTSSSDVVERFQSLVQSKPLLCKISRRNTTTGVHSVILSDLQSGQSIASVLIDMIEQIGF